MDPLTVAGLVVLVLLLFALWVIRRRARAAAAEDAIARLDTVAAWPPSATRILTTAERQAYKTLNRALPGYMILAKVPLARFLKVPSRQSYSEWLRRLGHQCADLVVCDMASEVIAVVSLRAEASDRSAREKKRHTRLARALKAARIPLHEWPDNALPTAERAREMLLPKPPAPTASRPSPLNGIDSSSAPLDEPRPGAEPPSSTWFDDFNSGPIPLQPPKQST